MNSNTAPAGLINAATKWHAARERERDLAAIVYEHIRKEHANGIPETRIAILAGVDRMTVRRALGKL
jgi:DNA invertase Pin-like site-specific DNA recombinase